MPVCKICDREFKNYISLGAHLKIHKLTSKNYYDNHLKTEEPICLVCGKETKFVCIKTGYSKYCSSKCSANSSKTKNKYIQTCLEKYYTKYCFQSKEFKEKSKKTCFKNHGVEYPSQSEIIRKKMKQTCLRNHGVEYALQSLKFKEKKKQTCLKKFGEEYPSQSIEIKEKKKQTCLEKYGVEYITQSKEFKKNSKQTCLKNYNVENPSQSPEIREKIKEKFRINMIDKLLNSNRLKDLVEPNFNINDYKNIVTNYLWKCKQCNNIFEDNLDNGRIPRCLNCYPLLKGISIHEKELVNFCKQYYSNLEENNRKILSGKELDIYIEELNLAIEFDGLYWHSESIQKDKYYHLNKTNECKKQNIKLIHIFEDEWFNKREIVESMLLNRMNKTTNKIYSRKCEIKIVSSEESYKFLENNHIQGSINSKINLGLYYNSELISLLTLGKSRYNKEFEYEIHRFCNKLDHNIPGSFSKLLKYFKINYSPKSIITYSDRKFGEGKVYEKNGFKFSHSSEPNYFYLKNFNRESRVKYQKHKLENLLETFDSTLTEWENMQLNGFDRIWDCGNNVWKWGK